MCPASTVHAERAPCMCLLWHSQGPVNPQGHSAQSTEVPGVFASSGLWPLGSLMMLLLENGSYGFDNCLQTLVNVPVGQSPPAENHRPRTCQDLLSPTDSAWFFPSSWDNIPPALPLAGSFSSFTVCLNASSSWRSSLITPSSRGFLSPPLGMFPLWLLLPYVIMLFVWRILFVPPARRGVLWSRVQVQADCRSLIGTGWVQSSPLVAAMSWMNKQAGLPGGQAAHSCREAYLLDREGADDILCQGLCFDQGDFNVSVDLHVIRPVSHTLHLRARTGTVRVSGRLSVCGHLIWLPVRINSRVTLVDFQSRHSQLAGEGKIHRDQLIPRGTGAAGDNGGTFFGRAPGTFQIYYHTKRSTRSG